MALDEGFSPCPAPPRPLNTPAKLFVLPHHEPDLGTGEDFFQTWLKRGWEL